MSNPLANKIALSALSCSCKATPQANSTGTLWTVMWFSCYWSQP